MTLAFQSFDCTLEYHPEKGMVLIRYLRQGRTFFTSCVRVGTTAVFRRMGKTLTEREATFLFARGITTL
jgi:hypothetical protein